MSLSLDEGAAHFAAGRMDAAAQAYRRAERLAPDDIRATYSLGVIDLRQGRAERAARRFEIVAKVEPANAPAWHNLGVARQQSGDWAATAAAYEQALAVRPEATETRAALAVALAILGRGEAAVDHYRVLAQAPQTRWGALTRIALIDPHAVSIDELADMRRATAEPALDQETRAGLWFAVGEVLDAQGEPDAAFEAYAAGNRLKRAALGDASHAAAQAHEASARRVREAFTREMLEMSAGKGDRTPAPIFIVGFPRSGSTLIEQILASHPDVQGLGETGALPVMLERDYPRGGHRSAKQLQALAERYLAGIKARGWNGASRFVDKTLENYLHVGLIALMFPNALILHSVRDPIETGFACWRQLFASGNETLYDLAEIAAEHRRYSRLMDHWRAVLPGRVIDVSYEALVAEPETAIRALVEAAGLTWDPATLRFFEREGAVATASAVQVRRPIYATSVARWRRHAQALGPLIEGLKA